MDWMRRMLTTSAEVSAPAAPLRDDITLEEVAQHNTKEDLWMILRGRVYNVTPYLSAHPGGEKTLIPLAGKDGTKAFDKSHRDVDIAKHIGKHEIGTLKQG
jgi:cytochrome-b5 reductase